MSMNIKINGVRIKQPKNPKYSTYNLTKAGRVASGKMMMDLVAKKQKLFFEYEILGGADLQQILNLIDGENMFFLVEFDDFDGPKSFTGYVGEIDRTIQRSNTNSGWYWTNVGFNLIEQ